MSDSFDVWRNEFDAWIEDLHYPRHLLGDFRFEPKYASPPTDKIPFGAFATRPKWRSLQQAPHQPIRDALLTLITVQGDTEFASVEQQRHLVGTAPTEYDRRSLVRVNAEEMRHGLQMAHLLTMHFGETGRTEAKKLLERRATRGNRLLKAFNDPVRQWVDFYCYTAFMDRDGKYQLTMLQESAFFPLASSMGPMLKEEAFHLGTGVTGLRRILEAGVIPTPLLQKYVNWWITAAYDCFGKDESGTAEWAYLWGLKGRFDEATTREPVLPKKMNEHNRALYVAEIAGILASLNRYRAKSQPPLYAPSVKFHRRVGADENETFDAHGERLGTKEYEDHVLRALPTPADEEQLSRLFQEEWIAPRAHA